MANCLACGQTLTEIERRTKLCSEHYFKGHTDGTKYIPDMSFVGTANDNNPAVNFIPANETLSYLLLFMGDKGHA